MRHRNRCDRCKISAGRCNKASFAPTGLSGKKAFATPTKKKNNNNKEKCLICTYIIKSHTHTNVFFACVQDSIHIYIEMYIYLFQIGVVRVCMQCMCCNTINFIRIHQNFSGFHTLAAIFFSRQYLSITHRFVDFKPVGFLLIHLLYYL